MKRSTCDARQYSDQMQCSCGLAWDVNDPEPPMCGKKAIGNATLSAISTSLSLPKHIHLSKLLQLKELQINHLPHFGIPGGLYSVHWSSHPHFHTVTIYEETSFSDGCRRYVFHSETGVPQLEVVRRSMGSEMRVYRDGRPGDWR